MPTKDSALMTTAEVAALLRCTSRTVENLRASGLIGFTTVGTGTKPRVFFTRDHVDAYLKAHSRAGA